jgi:hypothetical protein
MNTCAEFRFSKMTNQWGAINLTCHFDPPLLDILPLPNGRVDFHRRWPIVERGDWCGKFETERARQ